MSKLQKAGENTLVNEVIELKRKMRNYESGWRTHEKKVRNREDFEVKNNIIQRFKKSVLLEER